MPVSSKKNIKVYGRKKLNIKRFKSTDNSNKVILAIEEDGGVIIEDALTEDQMQQLDEDTANMLDDAENCDGIFHGYKTKRVGALIKKSKICQDMAVDPIVLDVMDHFLLPSCSDYQINLTQLISIGPGEKEQILHPDEGLFPFDHPGEEAMINVMWAVDDFTIENGATRIAPGSHKWSRDRMPESDEVTQAVMKKGSYFIYLGSAVHGGGANRSVASRRGIVMSYCLGWLRQSENQYLSVPTEVVKTLPERLQKLLGYFVHIPNLGSIDGADPLEYINGANRGKVQFKDFMGEKEQEILDAHYNQTDTAAWSDLKKKEDAVA